MHKHNTNSKFKANSNGNRCALVSYMELNDRKQ